MPTAHLRFVVVAASLAASLAACAQPLPADRAAYAGEWSGPGTVLSITPGGDLACDHVDYRRDVAVERDGGWTMAVSGVDLTKE